MFVPLCHWSFFKTLDGNSLMGQIGLETSMLCPHKHKCVNTVLNEQPRIFYDFFIDCFK